jgi:hypothetical protein
MDLGFVLLHYGILISLELVFVSPNKRFKIHCFVF